MYVKQQQNDPYKVANEAEEPSAEYNRFAHGFGGHQKYLRHLSDIARLSFDEVKNEML